MVLTPLVEVINIITKKGSSEPHGYASIEKGAYQTTETTAGISGGSDTTPRLIFPTHTSVQKVFSSYNENDGFSEKGWL